MKIKIKVLVYTDYSLKHIQQLCVVNSKEKITLLHVVLLIGTDNDYNVYHFVFNRCVLKSRYIESKFILFVYTIVVTCISISRHNFYYLFHQDR